MGKGKYTLRSIIVRCVVIMVGVFITAYGAEAFVLANLGSDPVTAFVQGLSKVLPFVHGDFGMAMNVFNVLCSCTGRASVLPRSCTPSRWAPSAP